MRRREWALLALLLTACSAPAVDPAEARRMIEQHPRFRAPQIVHVPEIYCGVGPIDPDHDPNHLRALESNRIIATTQRPAAPGECHGNVPGTQLFTVRLTDVAQSFHPMAGEYGGWDFVAAQRRFGTVHDVSYDDPESPKLAHVGYTFHWEPTLLGQLLQMGSIEQGASATLARDGNGWIVRQPGM